MRSRLSYTFIACIFLMWACNGSAQTSLGYVPGERLPDATFREHKATFSQIKGRNGLVLITADTECPVSARYRPRVDEIATAFAARGFRVAVVDVTPDTERNHDTRSTARLKVLADPNKVIATALRASSTAEAFVFDAAATLRYRGAIDDQYGLNFQREKPEQTWLLWAMESVASGAEPHITSTRAHGCPIATTANTNMRSQVTYHNRVSRIIQMHCQACHRVGGLGPMPLENYRQVYERRVVIEVMVKNGLMPPWSAKKGIGEWANDRSLSEQEMDDLLRWLAAGAPEGNPTDAPLPRRFTAGWNIGKPDAVVAIPEPFLIPKQGVIAYKYTFAKTNFDSDKWITAMEVRPTKPKAVHHVVVFVEEPGRKPLSPDDVKKLRPGQIVPPQPQDGVNGFFAVTVPGSLGITFPEGAGKRLPKGAWLKFEIHYQPIGKEVVDRTEIGFRFSSKPLQEVQSLSAFNADFTIPPYASNHEVRARYVFHSNGLLLSLFPHMHLRGKSFRYDVQYPNGRVEPLLYVPKFDFNWQSYYELKTPYRIPAGSTLLVTAWYDNSNANPWNPDPSRTVQWGQQTYEEMMIGYFDFVPDNEARARP